MRRPASLHQEVADSLRELIRQGDLAPGCKIPEAELCLQLQVSRTPLREAIKLLAAEGWIDLLLNRGARVSRVSARETRDLFEVLVFLERQLGDILAAKLSAQGLKQLEQTHRRLQRLHQKRRRREYSQLNQQFHHSLAQLTGNRILASTYQDLMRRASRARYLANLSTSRWDESMEEHEAIMQALRSQDAQALGRCLGEHLARTGAAVVDVLEQLQNP
ncbi:GntR family transcriptional regulator [Marinobacterium rhizophilum]|uniref:GntR family transcriptional regulator n=1 Tax=Marinobacterium rhizophilum TaxID=420402 RepID=A0ABY5HH40_9GAMM|nr:GntR family transcriptional regulator [Marinobacterium rhizophilum]UTW11605.1 GntR family transcriptional regulator [Marinobacterium rhizophilum]